MLGQDFLSKLDPAPMLHGVRFTSKGFGIQWEETAGAVTGMKVVGMSSAGLLHLLCGQIKCSSRHLIRQRPSNGVLEWT